MKHDNPNNLRETREKLNIEVGEVAEKLNVSNQYIYDLETGRRRLNEDVLKQLADLYGVSIDYLLKRENAAKPPELPTFHIYKKFQELDIESLSPTDQEKILEIVRGAVELTKGKNKKK
jgi:transcriptional regulator with XRE-family HTH domain